VAVSRETESALAAVVAQWFGPAGPVAYRYADLLATEGVRRGLIGPREVPRMWSRHILNCVVVHPLIAHASVVGDLGSGAGLPGIVLALARPDLRVTLIEPLLRRTRFLDDSVSALGLPNVNVVRSRAEDLADRATFDVVVARAVAPLERLAGWALPLCRPGGEVLALKGASARDEVARARPALTRLGAGDATIESCGVGVVEPATTVVRIQSHEPAPPTRGRS
jgi:16S rRNA (guanine527-N7)-methyltransferase